jgi:DNA-binding NarL/FixJ family response regulator
MAPGGHLGLADLYPAIRVLICDGHDVFRAGVRTIVEEAPGLEMVDAVGDGTQALAVARHLRPDIVVAAADLPRLGGPELVIRFAEDGLLASTKIILIVQLQPGQSRIAAAALRAGARGVLTRSQHADALTEAIRAVAHGNVVLAPDLADDLLAGPVLPLPAPLAPPPLESAPAGDGHGLGDLSERQLDVLGKICQGLSKHRDRQRVLPHRGHREDPRLEPAAAIRPARPHPARRLRLSPRLLRTGQ